MTNGENDQAMSQEKSQYLIRGEEDMMGRVGDKTDSKNATSIENGGSILLTEIIAVVGVKLNSNHPST